MGRVIKKTVSSLGCIKARSDADIRAARACRRCACRTARRGPFAFLGHKQACIYPARICLSHSMDGNISAHRRRCRRSARRELPCAGKRKSTARCSCLRSDCCLIICGIRSFRRGCFPYRIHRHIADDSAYLYHRADIRTYYLCRRCMFVDISRMALLRGTAELFYPDFELIFGKTKKSGCKRTVF